MAKQHDANTALYAIQQVQLWTLQISASRQAAQDLASHPQTAIAFCGEVAIQTNIVTLLPLSVTGNVGRTVAVLAKPQYKEDEQPLRLWVDDFSATPSFGRRQLSTPQKRDWLEYFKKNRHSCLSVRLEYALATLQNCQNYQDITAYQTLLNTWLQYAKIKYLGDILSIAEHSFSVSPDCPQWMQGGWRILQDVTNQLTDLKSYRLLESAESRRQYLTRQQKKLRALEWKDLPNYWAAIGKELVEDWIALFKQEKQQARQIQEFLHLEIDLLQDSLLLGKQPFNVRVHNPTSAIAEHLCIQMQETEGVFWCHEGTRHPILKDGAHTNLHLECQIDTPGRYVIRGQLTAQDLYGSPFQQPFDFKITVAEAVRAYTIPASQPYVVGEELSDDCSFVGRTDLLAWLASLWQQPECKPTVVLIGQRHIGKTSLLRKIERSGLAYTQLIPVFINIQSISREYEFLTTTINRMAAAIGMDIPTLDQAEPYGDFKRFLAQAKKPLRGGRFLLMLDEADLILDRKLGDLLPGFLRSLMQQHNSPTVLLFCGSYALKRAAWDSASILFNTAQFKAVSYLSAPESAELLQKPAQNILEFDDYVLGQAHLLTRGQPLLLQNLGAILIDEFNAAVRAGKERSNYLNFKDLEHATQVLIQQENTAFLEHWRQCGVKTHRVLSALAWATDEINRPQLDIDGILSALHENRLDLPQQPIFDIVQRLADEEILESSGPAYRFAVPLYRRWIALQWEPTTVREESLEDVNKGQP